jgi:CheY-like chemotaxis protein
MPPKHCIFIVDDDDDDRDSIRDAFLQGKHQFDFIFMSSADELVKKLRSAPVFPSLVLLDLNIPGKSGKDALQEIKSDKDLKHIPIIILTTSSLVKEKQAVYRLGANCFITKPDSFNQFVKLTDSIASLWLNPG